VLSPWYAFLFAKLDRITARHGYALALHGSMSRDLDLIAIPWTEDADDPEKLLRAIDRFVMEKANITRKGHKIGQFKETKEPHGRLAYSIYIGFEGNYLDLSIMPRIQKSKRRKIKK
jgi:hypothetical protein